VPVRGAKGGPKRVYDECRRPNKPSRWPGRLAFTRPASTGRRPQRPTRDDRPRELYNGYGLRVFRSAFSSRRPTPSTGSDAAAAVACRTGRPPPSTTPSDAISTALDSCRTRRLRTPVAVNAGVRKLKVSIDSLPIDIFSSPYLVNRPQMYVDPPFFQNSSAAAVARGTCPFSRKM